MRIRPGAALSVLLALLTSGCGLIVGPICRARQHTAPVATLTGDVAPGTVVVHRVKYGTAGSQNDLNVRWAGQMDSAGPRIHAYITLVGCEAFDPQIQRPRGDVCAQIGGIGSRLSDNARPCARNSTCQPLPDELVQTSILISHGRGNPERLGPEAEYKLWIVGDRTQATSYTIAITSFYGPDC